MTTMKRISSVFAVMAIIVCCSCGGGTKPNPENRTYENAYKSSSTATETETDNPYLENKLHTGAIPYNNTLVKVMNQKSACQRPPVRNVM